MSMKYIKYNIVYFCIDLKNPMAIESNRYLYAVPKFKA